MTTAVAPEAGRKLIRLSKALERLGFSRATFYRLSETDEAFPKPVRVRGLLLFVESEVDAYINALAESR